MKNYWIRKIDGFQISRNSTLGFCILIGIVLIVAVIILKKDNHEVSVLYTPSLHNVRVIDGDTIEINSNKIRLFGIDAPEIGQPCIKNDSTYDCGAASKEHLKFIIAGMNINCDDKGKDRWGRIISVCIADGDDINRLMVRHGWALAYRKYSSAYVNDEKFASLNKLGMWSKEFSTPSEWRKSKKG